MLSEILVSLNKIFKIPVKYDSSEVFLTAFKYFAIIPYVCHTRITSVVKL